MMAEWSERRRQKFSRLSLVAAAASVLLMLLGFFCALAPYLVFHTTRPSDYPLLRNAAPILLVASIVAFNLWVWLLIWPRMQRHAIVGSRGVRVVSWALGLLALSALAVYFSSTALMMINVTTTDWMVW